MREYTYEDCVVGKEEAFEVVVTEDMVTKFGEMSGDYNPLHRDEEFAIQKGYGERVVYGMLTASFLSTLAGMYLPGKNCLIQEVNIKFVKPVFINQKLYVSGKIVEKNDLFQQLVLKVCVKNQEHEKVLRGKMKVGVLK